MARQLDIWTWKEVELWMERSLGHWALDLDLERSLPVPAPCLRWLWLAYHHNNNVKVAKWQTMRKMHKIYSRMAQAKAIQICICYCICVSGLLAHVFCGFHASALAWVDLVKSDHNGTQCSGSHGFFCACRSFRGLEASGRHLKFIKLW